MALMSWQCGLYWLKAIRARVLSDCSILLAGWAVSRAFLQRFYTLMPWEGRIFQNWIRSGNVVSWNRVVGSLLAPDLMVALARPRGILRIAATFVL